MSGPGSYRRNITFLGLHFLIIDISSFETTLCIRPLEKHMLEVLRLSILGLRLQLARLAIQKNLLVDPEVLECVSFIQAHIRKINTQPLKKLGSHAQRRPAHLDSNQGGRAPEFCPSLSPMIPFRILTEYLQPLLCARGVKLSGSLSCKALC